jgi:hypothetical protein
MRTDTKKGVPGIPLAALDAIGDENTRQVLRAIVDGWHVRNGSSGTGDSRFVTAAELGDLRGVVGGLSSLVTQVQQVQSTSPTARQIDRLITDLQASVMESVLFKELGDRIRLIDQSVINGLAAEAIARQAAITNEATIRQTADTSLASQINTVTAAVNTNAAAIQNEATARVNGDNALSQQITTQIATVNGNLSALQTQQTTTANNVAALSQSVSTLQVTVGQNTAAIQNEATVRVNADNDIYAKYSVKIDNNNYVTGFGLISTSNNSTPFSEFIVRADRFAIGSPSGPGITPKVPFIVLTTTDSLGNAPGVYMDNAVIKNAAIGTAKIDNAAVNTLKIAGYAVTVPTYGQLITAHTTASVPATNYGTLADTYRTICSATVSISGLSSGETAGTIITGYTTFYEGGGGNVVIVTGVFINGTLLSQAGCTLGESKTNAITGYVELPNGTHTVTLQIKTSPGDGGGQYKNLICVAGVVIISGKR